MRCVKNIFIIFGLLGASQFIYGDDHGSQMQAPIQWSSGVANSTMGKRWTT